MQAPPEGTHLASMANRAPSVLSQQGNEVDAGSAWALIGQSTAQAALYLGFLAMPAALFAVGLVHVNLLNAGYLMLLIGWLAMSSMRLEPALSAAIVPFTTVSRDCQISKAKSQGVPSHAPHGVDCHVLAAFRACPLATLHNSK